MAHVGEAKAALAPQKGASQDHESREEKKSGSRLRHFAACAPCRRRKLRCDGAEPTCSTCARANRQCLYLDIRKGTRKQRTSIKVLEARLAELESRENSKQGTASADGASPDHDVDRSVLHDHLQDSGDWWSADATDERDSQSSVMPEIPSHDEMHPLLANPEQILGMTTMDSGYSNGGLDDQSRSNEAVSELMSLGQEEPLPPESVQNDLFDIYFERIDTYFRAIHQARLMVCMDLPRTSTLRPPVCLCYAMWALAALVSDSYNAFHHYFYQRARKYAEIDEFKSTGETVLTVYHAQTWCLTSLYESMFGYSTRGFLSSRKASALSVALGLHRLEGVGLSNTRTQPPPSDWIELEQRRRTFFMIFIHALTRLRSTKRQDRFLCVATGFPPAIDERDVQTHLPASDDAFVRGVPDQNMSLHDAMLPAGTRKLTPLATMAVLATLFGRILTQLHRPDTTDSIIDDPQSMFWRHFRQTDNTLINVLSSLQASGASGAWARDAYAVFLRLCARTCMICLHQAALFKAGDLPRLSQQSAESKLRCVESAQVIVHMMETVEDAVVQKMGIFAPFCLYLAMRVFVLGMKDAPPDRRETFRMNLQFLATRIQLFRQIMPFTKILFIQIDADLKGLDDLNPTGHIPAVLSTQLSEPEVVDPTGQVPERLEDWSNAQSPQTAEQITTHGHQPAFAVLTNDIPGSQLSFLADEYGLHPSG